MNGLMKLFVRAMRGMRQDLRLYLHAVASLTVAFVSLGAALWGLSNLARVSEVMGGSSKMTLFMQENATQADMDAIRFMLEGNQDVKKLTFIGKEKAREMFLRDAPLARDLSSLGSEMFPASIEIEWARAVPVRRTQLVADKMAKAKGVEDVETYRNWYQHIHTVLVASKGLSMGFIVMIGLCIVFIVGNTIRLSISMRQKEIEVMKLCGAQNRFVQGPFVMEGALQGMVASLVALIALATLYAMFHGTLDGTFGLLAGIKSTFLSPATCLGIVISGTVVAALSSMVSVRRYLDV